MNRTGTMERVNNTGCVTECVVPISRFHREEAERIFEEVRRTGTKMVVKNGDPECILISPEAYCRLVDEVEDAKLLTLAEERMAHYDPDQLIPWEKVKRELGLPDYDEAALEEVEFE